MSFCTVTATLNTVLGDLLQGNAFVRFRLRNFAGAVPRVTGTSIVAETKRDVFPDASGNISTQLIGNDVIVPINTFYTIEFWNNGKPVSVGNYIITGTSFDLDSNDPVNPPTSKYPFSLVLETDGVMNSVQNLQNLSAGTGITLEEAEGTVVIIAESGANGNITTNVNAGANIADGQVVSLSGTPAVVVPCTASLAPYGVNQGDVLTGASATIVIGGVCNATVETGQTITAGQPVTADNSGFLVPATAQPYLGYALAAIVSPGPGVGLPIVVTPALLATTAVGPRPGNGIWHFTVGTFNTLATAGASIGMSMTDSGNASLTAPTATEPSYFTMTSNAFANQYAVAYDLCYAFTLGILASWQIRVKIPATTNVRYWIAATDNNSIGGGQLEASLPACAIVGFRYVAGTDTNWQCYASPAGGGSHTLVDSGVLPSTTAGHNFEVRPAAGGTLVNYYIDNVQVGSISTTLPTTSLPLSLATHNDNVPGGGSGASAMSVAYWYWEGL